MHRRRDDEADRTAKRGLKWAGGWQKGRATTEEGGRRNREPGRIRIGRTERPFLSNWDNQIGHRNSWAGTPLGSRSLSHSLSVGSLVSVSVAVSGCVSMSLCLVSLSSSLGSLAPPPLYTGTRVLPD